MAIVELWVTSPSTGRFKARTVMIPSGLTDAEFDDRVAGYVERLEKMLREEKVEEHWDVRAHVIGRDRK